VGSRVPVRDSGERSREHQREHDQHRSAEEEWSPDAEGRRRQATEEGTEGLASETGEAESAGDTAEEEPRNEGLPHRQADDVPDDERGTR
jgi:hypothetical protein